MKKLVFLAAVCLPAAVLTLASWPGHAKSEVYVLVPQSTGDPYWIRLKRGMDGAAAELGVKVVFEGPSAPDPARQVEILQESIARRVAGIAVSPSSSQGLNEAIKRAVRRGIPVVTVNTDAPASERYVYIGTDNREAGRVAGRALVRILSGEGTVAILHGSVTERGFQRRLEGFREVVDPERKVEIVALEETRDDPDLAVAQAKGILRRFPKLDAFYATSRSGAPAAVVALREHGGAGRVKVVGFDLDRQNLRSVERGWISAIIDQNPVAMGDLAVRWLRKISRGERPGRRSIDTGVVVITRDNVAEALNRL